jgi:hypothetical protein
MARLCDRCDKKAKYTDKIYYQYYWCEDYSCFEECAIELLEHAMLEIDDNE